MNDQEKLMLCRGCRDDFYNDKNPLGVKRCWSFENAKPVVVYRIGWWTQPIQPGAFRQVETLSCHHAPGQYAHYKELPENAVEPILLKEACRGL